MVLLNGISDFIGLKKILNLNIAGKLKNINIGMKRV
jgi:hypothetical protein